MATYWENSCSFGLRCVSWYKCLIVSLVFPTSVFGVGIFFLIAPFPDLCLLVPLYYPSSENKGADQLRDYREADLRLCFRICRLFVFS